MAAGSIVPCGGLRAPGAQPRAQVRLSSALRNLLIIGLGVHGVGVLGACLAIGIALRSADNELAVEAGVSFPLLFLVVVLATNVCFATVHGAALWLVRRGDPRRGLKMMVSGGGVLTVAVVLGGFFVFRERFLLLGVAVAYAVPYCLAPLIVGLPTSVAAAVVAFRQRSGGRSRSQGPRLLR